MKLARKTLAALLITLLALGVSVPAMAYDYPAQEPAPHSFNIHSITEADFRLIYPALYSIRFGEEFTVSVEVLAPLPADAQVSFQWRSTQWGAASLGPNRVNLRDISGATGLSHTFRPGTAEYPPQRNGSFSHTTWNRDIECAVTISYAGEQVTFRPLTVVRLAPMLEITTSQNTSFTQGQDIVLSAQTNVPSGITVRHRWTVNCITYGPVISTQPTLHVRPNSQHYPQPSGSQCGRETYFLTVSFYRAGEQQAFYQRSFSFRTTVDPQRNRTAWEWIRGVGLMAVGTPFMVLLGLLVGPMIGLFALFWDGWSFSLLLAPIGGIALMMTALYHGAFPQVGC